ncbi:hypothetical protein BH10PSE3_BH10PSE3_37610 [soil metagenome]
MPTSHSLTPDRPSNREVENENQRPSTDSDQGASQGDGKAPRPATEPAGAEKSSGSPKTRTDPGSGEA